jgi:NTP pyrophosphatase (non-canonical NTP hydrolase)
MNYPTDRDFEEARSGSSRVHSDGLTFNALRQGNIHRLPEFKNARGGKAHSKADGSDWSPAQWLQAVVGELGEFANLQKKVERGDLSAEEAKPMLAKELADVATYLDILAFRLGVDLGEAVRLKFNEVSKRVGSSVRIGAEGWWRE